MKFIKVLASIVGFVGIGMQAPSAQAQVAIGDFIYADDNRNGEFDSTESGLQGVLVTVFTDDDNNATPDAGVDTTRTMASGEGGYYFEDLSRRYCRNHAAQRIRADRRVGSSRHLAFRYE